MPAARCRLRCADGCLGAQQASSDKENAMTYWEQVEAACGAAPATAGAEVEGKDGGESLDMLFN